MARNYGEESEYGLGLMPVLTPDGKVVSADSPDGVAALAAGGLPASGLGDAEALNNGADRDLVTELRAIYATNPDRAS